MEDLKRGASEVGDSGISPLELPPWLDMARCQRSRRFFAEHVASMVLAWHCSLVIGFSLPSLLSALVFTHASDSPSKSLKRYIRTFSHLVSWHIGNIWDPQSKAHASIQAVRGLHAGVRSQMQAHLPGQTWISMYDMACVQSGFMGALTIVPSKFGIRASDSSLEDYVYFWRCAVYHLGVADEFNLCSLGKQVSDKIVWELINSVLMQDIGHPPVDYHPIAKAYIDGMNLAMLGIPFFSVRSTLAISYWALGRDRGQLGFLDLCRFYYLRLILLFIGGLSPFRHLLNWVVLANVRKASENPVESLGMSERCPFTGLGGQDGMACPHMHGGGGAQSCGRAANEDGIGAPLVSRMVLTLVLLLPAALASVLAIMAFVAFLILASGTIKYGPSLVAGETLENLSSLTSMGGDYLAQ